MLVRQVSLLVFLIGISLAGYAGLQWLQTADWQPLTVSEALGLWPSTLNWLEHPQGWRGLNGLIAQISDVPAFLPVLLVGAALLFVTKPEGLFFR